MVKLPSQFQPGDAAYYSLPLMTALYCLVVAVRFYQGKVKYDIEVTLLDNSITRKYNIDSVFLSKKAKKKNLVK